MDSHVRWSHPLHLQWAKTLTAHSHSHRHSLKTNTKALILFNVARGCMRFHRKLSDDMNLAASFGRTTHTLGVYERMHFVHGCCLISSYTISIHLLYYFCLDIEIYDCCVWEDTRLAVLYSDGGRVSCVGYVANKYKGLLYWPDDGGWRMMQLLRDILNYECVRGERWRHLVESFRYVCRLVFADCFVLLSYQYRASRDHADAV